MQIGPYCYPDILLDNEHKEQIEFMFREMSDGYRSDSGIDVHGSIWETCCDMLQENLAKSDETISAAIEDPDASPIVRFGVSAALFPNMWAFDFLNQHEFVQVTVSIFVASIMMHNLKKFELSAEQNELFFTTFKKSLQFLYKLDDASFGMLFDSCGRNMFPIFEVANGDREKITNVMFGVLLDCISDTFSLSYTRQEQQSLIQPFAFCMDTAFNWEQDIAQHYQYKTAPLTGTDTIPPLPNQYDPELVKGAQRYENLLEGSNTMRTPSVRNINENRGNSNFWGFFRLGCYIGAVVAIIWTIVELIINNL